MSNAQPVRYIDAITRRYAELGYTPYRWFQADEPPAFTPLRKPLSASRLGVLSTAGAYVVGQVAFHYKDDTSIRQIPRYTPQADVHFSHITESYLEGPRRDPNCMVPLDALRTLESEGKLGELAPGVLSCMGGIYSQRRVREELIPQVEASFRAQQVDCALLVPM